MKGKKDGEQKEVIIKYIKLHLCILFFTFSTVMSKVAAQFEFLSVKYILCFAVMFGILGIYAIIWQTGDKGIQCFSGIFQQVGYDYLGIVVFKRFIS